jgi:hypothetical protein
MGTQAFVQCYELRSIMIPSSVQVIEHWAFRECQTLLFVQIATPSELRQVQHGAFYRCWSLRPIDIPLAAEICEGEVEDLGMVHVDGSQRRRVWWINRQPRLETTHCG